MTLTKWDNYFYLNLDSLFKKKGVSFLLILLIILTLLKTVIMESAHGWKN